MTTVAEYELRFQLAAGAVDAAQGLIRSATVAKAGVNAIGKFVCLDKDGNLTNEEEMTVTRLPVYTDEKTLATLMTAAEKAGGVLKMRSDHSDLLEARAGYADGFKLVEDRVTADLHLLRSYKDRDIVLETAASTPKLIGLSVDMIPSFDIIEGKAMMRIDELMAVDIVDGGAITPEGLFLSQTVDKKASINNPIKNMAEKPTPAAEPTVADCMKAITELAATVGKLVAAGPAAAAELAAKPADAGAAAMAATLAEFRTQLAADNDAHLVKMKKEAAALGLAAGPAGPGTITASNDDATKEAEKAKAGAAELAAAKPKGFLAQVDAIVLASGGKMRRTDATKQAMAADPKAYRVHLASKGIIPVAAAAA